jgi:hypothetical protein
LSGAAINNVSLQTKILQLAFILFRAARRAGALFTAALLTALQISWRSKLSDRAVQRRSYKTAWTCAKISMPGGLCSLRLEERLGRVSPTMMLLE